MAALRVLYFCLLLYYITNLSSSDVICEQGVCSSESESCAVTSNNCRINNATHNGIWLPSPSLCNCCEFCLPLYGEGEFCSTGGPGLGTTVGRCGDGLTCTADPDGGHSYCARMDSECHRAQDYYDDRHQRGETGALEQRPLCDGKGKYAPYDCVPAHTCFCQTDEGERLFGEVINQGSSTLRNMHCGCSILHAKIQKVVASGVPYPVTGPRCTSDGNFNPMQCIDRICNCVDKITGLVLEGKGRRINLDEEPLSELSCYDSNYDLFPSNDGPAPYNYTTPCLESIKERAKLIKQSQAEGYNVDYFSSFPTCMPDGTYGRVVKTRTGSKICVNERGSQIENYEAKPNTPEYNTIDCKCAQTSMIMASSAEKPTCCKNGNFRKIQCRRGLCRCVDSDGRQEGIESSDVTSLLCHTDDWRTC